MAVGSKVCSKGMEITTIIEVLTLAAIIAADEHCDINCLQIDRQTNKRTDGWKSERFSIIAYT